MKVLNWLTENIANAVPLNGVIETPGHYFLERDRVTKEQYNIRIECSNVTLDLKRHSLKTIADDPEKDYYGIYAPNQNNIHIFSGIISGASIGIHAPYVHKLNVENIKLHMCQHIGINFGGSYSRISQCQFFNIGGSSKESYAVGINSSDAQTALIEQNEFYEIYRNGGKNSSGEGVSILLGHDAFNTYIKNNFFNNSKMEKNTFAIWAMGKNHFIQANKIQNFQKGIVMAHSSAEENVLALKERFKSSIAISGIRSFSKKNMIINYYDKYGELDPAHNPVEEKIYYENDWVI